MTHEEAIEILNDVWRFKSSERFTEKQIRNAIDFAIECIKESHRHTQTFEWCADCKEYDQEKHCCHRWSKIIRGTVQDIRAEMANQIIEQIDKLYREPSLLVPKDDCLDLFKKIITDYRDGKGAWAKRGGDNG